MKTVSSPEICLRYQHGVSDLVDPYFQALALRQRISGRDMGSMKSRIGIWAVMLTSYNSIALATATIYCTSRLTPFAPIGPVADVCVMLGFILLTLEFYAVGRLLHRAIKYDTFFPIKQVGLSADGVRTLSSFMSRWEKSFFKWQDISSIKISSADFVDLNSDNGATGVKGISAMKPKHEPCLEIRDIKNRVMRLRLSAIRSIEERRVLVDMIRKYARQSVQKDDVAQIAQVSKIQDIAFTQLWSNALQSNMPRLAKAPLCPSTLLQEGRFLVKEQFGGGGQGAIYSAEMLSNTGEITVVALKEYVLPDLEHIFDRKRAIEQFEREVHLLTRLDHPSIVKLIDAFVEDHRAYLVMQYVSGETVRDKVKNNGPMSEQEAISVSLKLCDVLSFMHRLEPQVVHLDVAPDNIIMGQKDSLTLVDFNTSSDGSGLRTKLIAGKQRYMSPEQFRNEISPSCDIYALGCTMYMMLTGIEPEPLTKCDVRSVRSDVSDSLVKCIAQATGLELEQRTPSVENIESVLRSLLKTEVRS